MCAAFPLPADFILFAVGTTVFFCGVALRSTQVNPDVGVHNRPWEALAKPQVQATATMIPMICVLLI